MWALLLLAEASRLRRAGAEPAFGYGAHGSDWRDGSCQSRTAQSPVNLVGGLTTSPPSGYFEVSYLPGTRARVVSSGVSLVASGPRGGVVLEGDLYDLEEVAVHAPSEHTHNGARADLELQLVHGRKGSARKVVIAMLANAPGPRPPPGAHALVKHALLQQPDPSDPSMQVDFAADDGGDVPENPVDAEANEVGALEAAAAKLDRQGWALAAVNMSNLTYAAPNPLDPGYAPGLSGLLGQELPLPEAASDVALNATWDIGALVPEGASFVRYAGSGTVPPCTEDVQWLVSSVPTHASHDQVSRLTNAMRRVAPAGNWRTVMPFNRRATKVLAVQHRASLLSTTPPPDAKAPDPRKMAAWSNAEDAVVIADYAKRYARDLDQSLRTSAVAHLRGYIDPLPSTTTPAPAVPTQFPVPKLWLDKRQREKALHSAAANGVAAAVQDMVSAAARGVEIAASLGHAPLHAAIR